MDVTTPVVTGLAVAGYDSIKAMGAAAEGVVFAEYMVAEDPRPREKERERTRGPERSHCGALAAADVRDPGARELRELGREW